METLIPIVNKLQDVCHIAQTQLALDLPQIVVVGTQSSGKSSVIESIVRRDFLPRGTGTVTRRPLVIRLFKLDRDRTTDNDNNNDHHHHHHNNQHSNSNGTANHSANEWVTFHHLREKKFTDFDEVRKEIERETERLCGKDKDVKSEPILLNVYSKNVVNLTLIDLPGMVKVPVGDQPEDIELQIRDLIINYIKNPNSIILAVTPANIDFATSEAIQLARQYDPEGKRTLAVLTKLDLAEGSSAHEVLKNKLIEIKLGIIGVMNRSQLDIEDRKSIEQTIEDEAAFLRENYPLIADKNGQPYLTKRLSHLLERHIKKCIPDLRNRIITEIAKNQAVLDSFGEPVTDQPKAIIDIITKFSLSYCDTIKGGEEQIDTSQLCGGARIQWIFDNPFNRAMSNVDPLETLDGKAIFTAARNSAGVRTDISVSDVFRSLVKKQIKRLEAPSLGCVELVHKEMAKFVEACDYEVSLELSRFPKLREKIVEILGRLLDERLPATREAVSNLVAYGSAFINTKHPRLRESYVSGFQEPTKLSTTPSIDPPSRSMTAQQNGVSNGSGPPSVREQDGDNRECDLIARKIQAYFDIVRDETKEYVPRAIMHCMVNHVRSNLQSALIKEIYKPENFQDLLSESETVIRARNDAREKLVTLKAANDIINTMTNNR